MSPSAATHAARPLPGVLQVGLARTRIEVLQFFRQRDSMMFTFAFPVLMLFIFGSVFAGQEIVPGVNFTQYFAAGMIASGIVLSSFQQLAISIAVERDEGILKRLRGTPMPPAGYFLGKVGSVLVTSVIQSAVLLVAGVAVFGLELPTWMQTVGALFPLKWLTQGIRSVFLPDSFAAQEAAGSWELGRTALVLVAWTGLGLLVCLRTFRWQRREAP